MKILTPMLGNAPDASHTLEETVAAFEEDDSELTGLLFESQILRETDVGAIEFKSCQFINCKFSDCSFEKAGFTDVLFRGCDLSNCKLSEGVFHRVEFVNCKLLGCGFEEAYLRNVRFDHSACGYFSMTHADLKAVRFEHCDLVNASLSECKPGVEFEDSVLTGANFFRTPLAGIDLSSCETDGICVAIEDLKGVIVTAAQALELSHLMGLKIKT